VVRADLRDHASGRPAAHAVLVVETPAGRSVGVADGDGHVVVAFPFPDFAVSGPPGSIPAGSHGIPTVEQQWSVSVSVRWQPTSLRFPAGVDVPFVHTVFGQAAGTVHDLDSMPGQVSIPASLTYGRELSLATDGVVDPLRRSYLFVEPAP
jgi:hypothetical protein